MTVLHPGIAQGPVLLLDEPLSFWGAFDPRSGIIIDIHHPQRGQSLNGKILMMLESRGSGQRLRRPCRGHKAWHRTRRESFWCNPISTLPSGPPSQKRFMASPARFSRWPHRIFWNFRRQPICISPMTARSAHPSTIPKTSARRRPMKFASITQRLSGSARTNGPFTSKASAAPPPARA